MACAHLSLQFPSGVSRTLPRSKNSPPVTPYRGSPKGRVSAFSSSFGTGPRPELDDNPEGIISGEWPDNFSLLTFDDLRFYLEENAKTNKPHPTSSLGEVMSTSIITVTADQTLEEVEHHFEYVSGLPVVDDDLGCIGIISKSDRAKARASLGIVLLELRVMYVVSVTQQKSTVGEVMSSPPITLPPSKTVKDAAALMLKMKIHRIPIVDERNQVIGIITRTDVFEALEATEV
ncbi:uncharacterized protein M6B38_318120 [Iris pallida]|uniref:CBS domain-containing protein n=1 Tax=Iris pallida TaxID=29817 RepID=A0AAX6HCH8_IRIPA|nr:uncharacterized protein M6B38_318120 [Iris pallida]